METLKMLLNNDAVITSIVGVFAWIVAKVFAAKPAWVKYEGLMITAIKAAEKLIPDDGTTSVGLQRADQAMREFVRQYCAAEGKNPGAALVTSVREALPLIHAKLETNGNL
jgi:hypothetical protein